MQDFPAIPIFISVIEEGSFSKAAERLGITKSAVSKRISNLEANLGVKLLHRTTRKLSLTEAGARYYDHASHALAAAQDAEYAAAELQEKPKGTLRISAPMSFGRLHVAPIITRFLAKYPQINIEMDMSDLYRDLVAEGFDMALSSRLPETNLVARKIAPLHSVLCASHKYLEQHGKPKHPQELVTYNCVLYSYHTVVNEWVFSKNKDEIRVQVKGNFKVNNSEALREALVHGLGIGRLPTFVAGQDFQDGKLVPVLTDYKMPHKVLYAVFPERRFLPLKVRVFMDYLIEQLGGHTPYWDCWDSKSEGEKG